MTKQGNDRGTFKICAGINLECPLIFVVGSNDMVSQNNVYDIWSYNGLIPYLDSVRFMNRILH